MDALSVDEYARVDPAIILRDELWYIRNCIYDEPEHSDDDVGCFYDDDSIELLPFPDPPTHLKRPLEAIKRELLGRKITVFTKYPANDQAILSEIARAEHRLAVPLLWVARFTEAVLMAASPEYEGMIVVEPGLIYLDEHGQLMAWCAQEGTRKLQLNEVVMWVENLP